LTGRLIPTVEDLRNALTAKAQAYSEVIKIGRTHLMDAVPLTTRPGVLPATWLSWTPTSNGSARPCPGSTSWPPGGTAVGTGLNTHPEFGERVAAKIAEITEPAFVTAPNKFAALAATTRSVWASAALRTLAGSLMKIADDLRWLGSDPGRPGRAGVAGQRAGLVDHARQGEPTQSEAIDRWLGIQVIGQRHRGRRRRVSRKPRAHVNKPVIIYNVIHSIELLRRLPRLPGVLRGGTRAGTTNGYSSTSRAR